MKCDVREVPGHKPRPADSRGLPRPVFNLAWLRAQNGFPIETRMAASGYAAVQREEPDLSTHGNLVDIFKKG